jgi:hypothetical protein
MLRHDVERIVHELDNGLLRASHLVANGLIGFAKYCRHDPIGFVERRRPSTYASRRSTNT